MMLGSPSQHGELPARILNDMNEPIPQWLLANLQEQGDLLRGLLDNAPLGIWMHEADGRLGFVNKTFADMVGLSVAELLAMEDYTVLFDADTAARCRMTRGQALAAPGPHRREERVGFANGQIRDLEIVKLRMHDRQGEPNGRLLCMAADITERKISEGNTKLLAAVFANAREGITIADADGNIIAVNARFSEITGYASDEVIGKNPRVLKSGRHDRDFYAAMWKAIKDHGHWRGEIWNRRRSGEIYPELLSITELTLDDSAKSHYLAVFTDISELKAQQANLEYLAHHDALTRLPNRVMLADRMRTAMARSRRFSRSLAVCYLDLDGFKPVNDHHGHHFGDRLLYEIGQRLSQSLRGADSVARFGGDEFVLLLGNLESLAECQSIAARLLEIVSQPVIIDNVSVKISASLGVTLYPDDDADADTLLRHADHALYQAKELGRNRYVMFDASHAYRLRAVRAGRRRFDEALAANHLRLYFQPKVDLQRGSIVGAEALVRWCDPQIGVISPPQFLSFIENTSADIMLGEFVIQAALRQIAEWQGAGVDLAVSINISAYHLAQRDFVSRLKTFLEEQPLAPARCLEIEILETAAIEDLRHVTEVIEQCRALGVEFSIDDFGTGYSSLTYFKHLPVSTLKIDQTFIRNMLENGDDLAIVEGIIGLSQAFRRSVIAEGVETVEHGVRLIEMGCHVAQGYAIAPPMPADEFANWAREWCPAREWLEAAAARHASPDIEFGMLERDLRRWLDDFRKLVESKHSGLASPAILKEGNCRFGQWLQGEGFHCFGHQGQFANIVALHREIHAIGHELYAISCQNQEACEIDVMLDKMLALNERLILELKALPGRARADVRRSVG